MDLKSVMPPKTLLRKLKSSLFPEDYHFSFLTIHYGLIIGTIFITSICLFSSGNLSYTDALFQASGAATQSGLNTIDLNLLKTWQQAVIYFVPMITNPITINTYVVFLRLWWFEKRFDHVVKEARRVRRNNSKTTTRAKKRDKEQDWEGRHVSGRQIVVMHPRPVNDKSISPGDPPSRQDTLNKTQHPRYSQDNKSKTIQRGGETTNENILSESLQRQIKFVDQVELKEEIAELNRLPIPRHQEEDIAFLQRQRNAEKGEVLRIPGPREADAGMPPHRLSLSSDQVIFRRTPSYYAKNHTNYSMNIDQSIQNTLISKSPTNLSMTPVAENFTENDYEARYSQGGSRSQEPRIIISDHRVNSRHGTSLQKIRSVLSRDKNEANMYLSWQPTIGRNSTFHNLTAEQRDELGGIEYRSLKTLAVVLVSYFLAFSVLGTICLIPWILNDEAHGRIVMNDGVGRIWWGIFTANSAFTDLGFTLTPDSMISFQLATWPLLIMSFLITIGNAAFPIMLRIIIWVGSQVAPRGSGVEQELNFLLDHPRRCFTLLFPARATIWLAMVLIILSSLDVLFFIVLDLGKTIVTELPVRIRILDGLFQAISTRTAGFTIVDLSLLHPAIQVSYLVMMYISVFPIAISIRHTNVYEERSLGIYGLSDYEEIEGVDHSYVTTHLRHQLSFDLWYICLGLFIIAISEGSRLQSGDPRFTLFAVLFEIVSAYGTVGLSLGYKDINASLSAEFGVMAKIVIIAMQIRGRHRGLPHMLDRAIILPSEKLQEKAEEDLARFTQSRRVSNPSVKTTGLIRTISKGQASDILDAVFKPGPPLPRRYRNLKRADSPPRSSSISSSDF